MRTYQDIIQHEVIARNKCPIRFTDQMLDRFFQPARSDGKFASDAQAIPYTPSDLVADVSQRIPAIRSRQADATIAVFYTIEWAIKLEAMGFTDITLITQDHDPLLMTQSAKYNYKYKTLEAIDNMKFDVVVGNPPYQLQHKANKSIYHEFVLRSMSMAASTSLIIPTTFMRSAKSIFKNLRTQLRTCGGKISIDTVDAHHFPTVQVKGGMVVLTVDCTSEQQLIINGQIVDFGEAADEFVEPTLLNLLAQKITNSSAPRMDVVKGTNSQRAISPRFKEEDYIIHGISMQQTAEYPYPFISSVLRTGPVIAYGKKSLTYTDKPYALITPERSKGDQLSTLTEFANINEYCLTINVLAFPVSSEHEIAGLRSYVTSNVFRLLMGVGKDWTDGANIVGKLRSIPAVDFTRVWSDVELYDYFNLTAEEIALIEETIR